MLREIEVGLTVINTTIIINKSTKREWFNQQRAGITCPCSPTQGKTKIGAAPCCLPRSAHESKGQHTRDILFVVQPPLPPPPPSPSLCWGGCLWVPEGERQQPCGCWVSVPGEEDTSQQATCGWVRSRLLAARGSAGTGVILTLHFQQKPPAWEFFKVWAPWEWKNREPVVMVMRSRQPFPFPSTELE